MIHLTLTGPNAGQAACMAVRDGVPDWGATPLPEGDRGVHYAYAPADMQDGTRPDMCQECVTAWKNAGDPPAEAGV